MRGGCTQLTGGDGCRGAINPMGEERKRGEDIRDDLGTRKDSSTVHVLCCERKRGEDIEIWELG
jgi:hypothetical protein